MSQGQRKMKCDYSVKLFTHVIQTYHKKRNPKVASQRYSKLKEILNV